MASRAYIRTSPIWPANDERVDDVDRRRQRHRWCRRFGNQPGAARRRLHRALRWHRGDGDASTLSSIAKVTGVLSPGDDPKSYPFERMLFRRWAGVPLVAFGRNVDPADVPTSLAAEIHRRAARVVLFGGRRTRFRATSGGAFYFCPGSANPRRRRDLPSVGLIELSGSRVRAEVVTVER